MKKLNKDQKMGFLVSILEILEKEKSDLKAQKNRSVLHAEAYNFITLDIYDTKKEIERLKK